MRRLILILIALAITTTAASAGCLTHREARGHYGTVWLYWHTERHCWDSTPGHHRHRAARHEHHRRHHEAETKKTAPRPAARVSVAPAPTPFNGTITDEMREQGTRLLREQFAR